ncbi:MAG: hypothetical protein Q9181_006270, partial [Wetmoreana brouardii]
MGKKRKQLSHEEIWDDRALLDSWDAALQEYQLYHSIHARGERVEDVLKQAEASERTDTNGVEPGAELSTEAANGVLHSEDLEDGEMEDGQIEDESHIDKGAKESAVDSEEIYTRQRHDPSAPALANHAESAPAPPAMPGVLINSVQDEDLKNLMMSWYYAGYCTGLYEGDKMGASYMSGGTNEKNAMDMNSDGKKDGSMNGEMSQKNAMDTGSGDPSITVISSYKGGNAPMEQMSQPTMNKGATHMVTVGGDAGLIFSPNTIMAAPGDMVHFTFMSTNHTLTQSTFDKPCVKMQGGADSGFLANPNNTVSPPPTFMFQVKDTKPAWFYCKQKKPANHCGKGMTFSINPTAEKTQNVFMQMAMQQNGTAAGGAT